MFRLYCTAFAVLLVSFIGCSEEESIAKYTVTFNTGDGSSVESQTVENEGQVVKPYSPTKSGSIFAGWYEDASFIGDEYNFTSRIVADITLYAKWTMSSYTVTFNTGGGSLVEPQTVENKGNTTEPSPPTRLGYTFAGWYSDISFSNSYDFTSQEVVATLTLYAKWTINIYEITFQANGGSPVESQTVESSGHVTKPPHPARPGYTFAGWYGDLSFNIMYNFNSPVTSTFTLYAQWVVDKYTVTFNTNGGSSIKLQVVERGDQVTEPSPPTRPNYTFSGWYNDMSFSNSYDFTSSIVATLTLYAKWTIDMYEVAFQTNGGSPVESQTVESGGHVTRPSPPTRLNYTFVGWYSNVFFNSAYDFNYPVEADLILYAQWQTNPYTVSFDTGEGSVIESQIIEKGNLVTRPSPPPTRISHTFVGWYSDATFNNAYNFSSPVTSSFTIHARWVLEIPEGVPILTTPIEGNYAVFDVIIDLAPSEDIILEGVFSIDNIINYVNDEDYTPEFEYSNDLGNTWQQEVNKKRVKILAEQMSVRVRVPTQDDNTKEVLEEWLSIQFSLFSGPPGYIAPTIDPIVIKIQDNDLTDLARTALARDDPRLDNIFMGFNVSVNNEFILYSVSAVARTIQEKQIIDGLYLDVIDAVSLVNEQSPTKLDNFYISYEVLTEVRPVILGYVQPLYRWFLNSYNIINWAMTLNVGYAFNTFTLPAVEQSFNDDGDFGSTIVHEYGHVLTLNNSQGTFRLPNSIESCRGEAETYSEDGNISTCYNSDSYAHKFITDYYDNDEGTISGKIDLIEPSTVSNYASTHYGEDLAESYAAYVFMGDRAINSDMAFINKINFYDGFQESKDFKTSILETNLAMRPFGELWRWAPLNREWANQYSSIPSILQIEHKNCVRPVIID